MSHACGVDDYVLGLDIAVNHPPLVDELEGSQQWSHNLRGWRRRQGALTPKGWQKARVPTFTEVMCSGMQRPAKCPEEASSAKMR